MILLQDTMMRLSLLLFLLFSYYVLRFVWQGITDNDVV